MEVVQIVAGLDPSDGGPAYSVPSLAKALAATGLMPITLAVGARQLPDLANTRLFAQTFGNTPVLSGLRQPGLIWMSPR